MQSWLEFLNLLEVQCYDHKFMDYTIKGYHYNVLTYSMLNQSLSLIKQNLA